MTDFAPGEEDTSPHVAPPNRHPWENDDGSTNVEGFLAAYAEDDNTYWRAESGHIQNVLDYLIDEWQPKTYKLVIFCADEGDSRHRTVIDTRLPLAEAQAYCQSDDTHGDGWFVGYEEEK